MFGTGLIRFLLAFSVVVEHTSEIYGFNIINSVVAVRLFYVLSGFYISLVLGQKYKNNILHFWKNRILKIYPVYLVILFLTVAFSLLAYLLRGSWGELGYLIASADKINLSTWLTIVTTNLIIIGRNLVMFSGFNPENGELFFRPDFIYEHPAYTFLLIPQAWAFVIIVNFYILAPVLVKIRTQHLFIFTLILFLIRTGFIKAGFNHVYWTNRFFPTELPFFLMGIISYRFYKMFPKKLYQVRWLPKISTAVSVMALLILNYLKFPESLKINVFYISFILLLPFVFFYSKDSKLDRFMGDLSYPIYLSHILITMIIYPTFFNAVIGNKNFLSVFVFICSILFSLLINNILMKPAGKYKSVG